VEEGDARAMRRASVRQRTMTVVSAGSEVDKRSGRRERREVGPVG